MLPIIWLFGTSGVGKSTVGYRTLSHLDAAGATAAFVDADQLRLANAVRASETELIAAALPPLIDNYQAHGAQVLIVAGVLDDADHLARLLPQVPRLHVLAIQLDADSDTIRERVRHRGWLPELADAAVDYAARIDPDLADLRLDTTGRSPDELAPHVTSSALAHLRQTNSDPDDTPSRELPTPTPRRTIAITGPGGVGVSTVGFQTFSLLANTDQAVGYLDTHQLGLLGAHVRGDHLGALRAANADAVAGCLASAGADIVVVSGDPRTIRMLIDAEHEKPEQIRKPELVWLDASMAALTERLTMRAQGVGPVLQGDHRVGLTGPALADAITAAVDENQHEARPGSARTINTSDLDPRQVAALVLTSPPPNNNRPSPASQHDRPPPPGS